MTETSDSAGTTDVYIFAHQDDEFGAFESLRRSRIAGHAVWCIYLTDGASDGRPRQAFRRNAESRRVLEWFGIMPGDIHFLGTRDAVGDGRLVFELPRVLVGVARLLYTVPGSLRLFSHAWEGGHPDHDAAHLLLRRLARDLELPEGACQCFALYNSLGLPRPLFRVLKPIAGNGTVTRLPITWQDRLRYLRACLSYPSQWRSWLGLFPMVSLHLVLVGHQSLQQPRFDCQIERPHSGRLMYEARYALSYEAFQSAAVPEFYV